MELIQPPARGLKILLLLIVAGGSLALRWPYEPKVELGLQLCGITFALSAVFSLFRLAARKPYRSPGHDAGGAASSVLMACGLFSSGMEVKGPFLAGGLLLVYCTLSGRMDKLLGTAQPASPSPPSKVGAASPL